MKTNGAETKMTLGEKLKSARKNEGLTQEQLAEKLMVSRQAITKWESDKGMPDIENLKQLSRLLNVSIDYLLDDGGALDFSEMKKPIDLAKYGDGKKLSRIKKAKIKEQIIREEYPDSEIIGLTVTGFKNSKAETIADEFIGWFALILCMLPLFGTIEFGKMANCLDQQYYLVNEEKAQYFVLLTDEHIITRTLTDRITDKKFEIGDKKFLVVGKVK
jgi:transcriptional regulator with XRE-family HTH domain